MTEERSERQVRDFYQRWSRPVFAFCRLFLGDEEGGEAATREAFLAYVRQGLPLVSDQLPVHLLRCALEAVKDKCALVEQRKAKNGTLEHTILLLPSEQRAVFIFRTVLHVDTASVAFVTGLPTEQVRQLWIQSVLAVRELMPREFFKERTQ